MMEAAAGDGGHGLAARLTMVQAIGWVVVVILAFNAALLLATWWMWRRGRRRQRDQRSSHCDRAD
jgi:cbb3-type cytochrome oxidase subunit 3